MMDNGNTLFISLLLFLLIGIVIQIALYRNRQKQRSEYPKLWKKFELSLKNKNYNDLLETGDKLTFNSYLTEEGLSTIYQVSVELEAQFPEFKSLRLKAYNKQLHYQRIIPGAGSSGGIKQTWFDKE